MVGEVFGNLVVIGYDAEQQMATVRCGCGQCERVARRRLLTGRVHECSDCRQRTLWLRSLQRDLDSLQKSQLERRQIDSLLQAYRRHLAVCRKYQVAPVRLATFITEALADSEFDVELDQSFEARYLRSNPHTYHQYEGPKDLI